MADLSPEVEQAINRLGPAPHYCDESCDEIPEVIPNPAFGIKLPGGEENPEPVPEFIPNPDKHVVSDKETDHAAWHLAVATQVCRATHMMMMVPCDACMQRVEDETGHAMETRYDPVQTEMPVPELTDADRNINPEGFGGL
jgi:hypothetical protein